MKKYLLLLAINICFTSLYSQTNELRKIVLDSGRFCYILTEQDDYIEANKQHYDLRLGNEKITDAYTNELHEYIQAIIDETPMWPITNRDDFSIDIIIKNNGQIIGVELYTSLSINNSTVLINFFNEVSKWQKPFEPPFSNDSSKIYLIGWGLGSFKPGDLSTPIK